MRLFIACDLSATQKHELEAIQHQMTSYLPGVRWVKPQGLHLTLTFLGDREDQLLQPLQQALTSVASIADPFLIQLGGCGVFPHLSKARVLWIGIKEGVEVLQIIKKDLDLQLEPLGFVAEKRLYQPHLTLGRMRYPLEERLIKRFIEETESFSSTPAKITKIILYESQLTPKGAHYYPQFEADLLNRAK